MLVKALKAATALPIFALIKLLDLFNPSHSALKSVRALLAQIYFVLVFDPRPDDIYISTFPKSGTTWTQMILVLLTQNGQDDFAHIDEAAPWLESVAGEPAKVRFLTRMPSPRVLKTHLRYRVFPKNTPGKFIYVVRDGTDVAVSQYHHLRHHFEPDLSFDGLFESSWDPKTARFTWFQHVGEWLTNSNGHQLLVLRYEDLKSDMTAQLHRIAAFCQLPLDDQLLEKVLARSSFNYMKQEQHRFDIQQGVAKGHVHEAATELSFLRAGKSKQGVQVFSDAQLSCYIETFKQTLTTFPLLEQYLVDAEEALKQRLIASSPSD